MSTWTPAHERLYAQILQHVKSGIPHEINLSLPRHGVASGVLHRSVYDEALAGRRIKVTFLDGSRVSEGFPVGCLEPVETPAPSSEPALRLGLMSFRHPELDYLVDLYVTRNRELAEQPSMADEERLAFERTVALLEDTALEVGGDIWTYHTGLEPMVVGFYRAVVHVLRARKERKLPRTLVIRPFLYQGPKSSGPIDHQSPGAMHEYYKPAEPWS